MDGFAGDHVLLAPPFICTPDDMAEIVSRLSRSLEAVLDRVRLQVD